MRHNDTSHGTLEKVFLALWPVVSYQLAAYWNCERGHQVRYRAHMPRQCIGKSIILLHELAEIGIKGVEHRIAYSVHSENKQYWCAFKAIVAFTLLLNIDFWRIFFN